MVRTAVVRNVRYNRLLRHGCQVDAHRGIDDANGEVPAIIARVRPSVVNRPMLSMWQDATLANVPILTHAPPYKNPGSIVRASPRRTHHDLLVRAAR